MSEMDRGIPMKIEEGRIQVVDLVSAFHAGI